MLDAEESNGRRHAERAIAIALLHEQIEERGIRRRIHRIAEDALERDRHGAARLPRLREQLAEHRLCRLVVGHELAHANLGHLAKRRTNAVIGWIGGAAADAGIMLGGMSTNGAFSRVLTQAGARAFSVAFEREADYVGAYYAARAGYDLAGSEEIWRTFSLEDPDSIRLTTDHPITPVRFVQMQKVIDEIENKKRRNLPLVPEQRFVRADVDGAGSEVEP